MKRKIRLTESELTTLIKRMVEQAQDDMRIEYNEDIKKQTMHDLRNGTSPFKVGFSGQRRARMGMIM